MILLTKKWGEGVGRRTYRARLARREHPVVPERGSWFERSAAAFSAAFGAFGSNPFRMCTYTNATVSHLECALTESLDLKSFRIRTYENKGEGMVQSAHLPSANWPKTKLGQAGNEWTQPANSQDG